MNRSRFEFKIGTVTIVLGFIGGIYLSYLPEWHMKGLAVVLVCNSMVALEYLYGRGRK